MDKIEAKHMGFLRKCATLSNSIHSVEGITTEDADALTSEGLLIRYNKPTGPKYCISRYGAQFVKENSTVADYPEMRKLALTYIISKGYDEEAAEKILEEQSVETILLTQAEEMRNGTQRDVKPPTNERGEIEFKFKG